MIKPQDESGEDEHRAIVERALLVSRGESTPLLKPIDAALDEIAPSVDRWIEDEGTTGSQCPLRTLVASLRDGVLDLSLTQPAATARVAIALVGDEVI